MKTKKSIALLLSLIMASMPLASCSETTTTEPVTETATNETDVTEIVDAADDKETSEPEDESSRASVNDSLPSDLNFNAMTVNVLYRGGTDEMEIMSEELTGDVVSDAVYNRNLSVEDRLNVKFNFVPSGMGTAQDFPSAVKTAITSNVDDYQIVSWAQYSSLPLCTSNLVYNVFDTEYFDFSKPWWNEEYMKSLQIGTEKRFFLMGDINLNALRVTASVFFNQNMYSDLYGNPSEVYQTVLSGEWTIDKLKELSSGAYTDTNGNSQADKDDIYGVLATTVANTELFAFGLGLNVIKRGEDELPEIVIQNERNYDLMAKLNDLYYNNDGMYSKLNDGEAFNGTGASDMFASNKVLFLPLWLKTCENLREMESDYGIIPYPKFDTAQENYVSMVQDTTSCFFIPVTCATANEISAVIEAMCAESYRTVTPAYYDIALKEKFSRDEISIQMIDLIHDTSRTDFAYAYNYALGGLGLVMRNVVQSNGDMASTVAKSTKVYSKSLTKLITSYQEMG